MKRKFSPGDSADTNITAEARHPSSNLQSAPASPNGLHATEPVPIVAGSGLAASWLRFWFTPASANGLHVIRVLAGLLFSFWLLAFMGQQEDFFSLKGWLDLQAYRDAAKLPGVSPAPFGWSILYLAGTDMDVLNAMYWSSVAIVILFTLGIATRLTSVLTWIVVVSFIANPVISYDADFLLVILAFYLMVGYLLLGQWSRPLSWPARIFGSSEGGILALRTRKPTQAPPVASYAANVALRLLQVHFAIVIVTSALHKLQIGDWWAGAAFWYPMHPPLQTTYKDIHTTVVADWQRLMFVLSLGAYLTMAWQLAFPLFAWKRGIWRLVLIGGGLLGWIGSIFILRLPLFGPLYVIVSLSFLSAAEWQAGINWVGERFGAMFGGLPELPARVGKSTRVGT